MILHFVQDEQIEKLFHYSSNQSHDFLNIVIEKQSIQQSVQCLNDCKAL